MNHIFTRVKLPAALLLLALWAPAHAMDERSLAARDPLWNTLRQSGDADALDKLIDERFVLIHSDGRIQHKADYLAELRTRARVNTAIGNEEVTVRTYGATGVVNGVSVQSGISDGQPWSGRFRFTRTWIWRAGEWVLVSSHSSRIAP
jgi:hypothetical protein